MKKISKNKEQVESHNSSAHPVKKIYGIQCEEQERTDGEMERKKKHNDKKETGRFSRRKKKQCDKRSRTQTDANKYISHLVENNAGKESLTTRKLGENTVELEKRE